MDHDAMAGTTGRAEPPMRREVSIRGRFLGMAIIGSAVIASIFIEKFGAPATQSYILPLLGASVVLGVGVPLLFCRRWVPED